MSPDGVVYLVSGYLLALDPNGSLMWETKERQSLGGAPAIGEDGTIYVNSHDPDFYAYSPDGTLKWSYHTGDCCPVDLPSSPAIGTDGTVYAGQTVLGVGMVLAFTPDGSVTWQASHGGELTALSIGGDGTVYFGSGSHNPASVYALNPDGTLKWQYDDPGGGYVRISLAIGRGHRVYAGSLTGFFALGP